MAAEMAPTDARPYLSLGRLAASRSQPAGAQQLSIDRYIDPFILHTAALATRS